MAYESNVIPLPPMEMPATALAPGGLMGAIARRQPVGAVAAITPVQLPGREHGGQARSRARDGQHGRRAPRVAEPARGHRARADHARGRVPARCRQRRHRLDARHRRGARRDPRHRHGVVHRLDRRRHADRRGRRPHDEAPAPRARRQGRRARLRRREPQDRDRHDRLHVDVPLRPDLHRADARDRAARRLRPGRRGPHEDGRHVEGRRPVRARHGARSGHHRRAPRPGRELHRVGPRRRGGGRRRRRRDRRSPTRATTSRRRCSRAAGST